jgi:hypothetical protein
VTRAISDSPGYRIGHAVHDQLSEGEVEAVVRKGKTISRGGAHVDPGQPRAEGCNERGGGVDRRDSVCAQPVHQLGGQSARPAPDVQCTLARLKSGKFREPRRQRFRESTHEPVVGVCSDVEAHAEKGIPYGRSKG